MMSVCSIYKPFVHSKQPWRHVYLRPFVVFLIRQKQDVDVYRARVLTLCTEFREIISCILTQPTVYSLVTILISQSTCIKPDVNIVS